MTKAPHQKHRSLFALKAGETRGSTRVGLQRLLFLRGLVTLAGLVGTFVFHAFSPLALPLPAVAVLLLVMLRSVRLLPSSASIDSSTGASPGLSRLGLSDESLSLA